MLSQIFPAVLALAFIGSTSAAPAASAFYQSDESITALFRKRAPSPDDPNFASNYPPGWATPPASGLPKAWTDKLASIQLPDVGVSSANNGYPTYPNNESGASQHICSFTYECTTSDDLVNPPDGIVAVSFDDGPTAASPALYDFLAKNNIADKVTHFMIGGNVLGNPKGMQSAVTAGGHIGVHTWSHPYMTTLSNEGVLAELGWTMQIIADLNGGRIPKYWRPPFGDVDNRVRAIAKGVFGLETVPWNRDSGDWAIDGGTYTKDQVNGEMSGWLKGSKSPGLCILEHESHDSTVDIFTTQYPNMVSNGWTIKSIADAWGMDWYLNAASGNTGAVTSMVVAGDFASSQNATTSAAANATSTAATNATSTSVSPSSAVSGSTVVQSQSGTTTAGPSGSGTVSAGSNAASPSASKTGGAVQNLAVSGSLVGVIAMLGLVGALL